MPNPLNYRESSFPPLPIPGDAGYDFIAAIAGGMAGAPRHVPIGVSVASSRPGPRWSSRRLSAGNSKTDNEREMDDLKFVL